MSVRQEITMPYCMVEGEFPEEEISCEQPLKISSVKLGICLVDIEGKDSKTTFQRVAFENNHSIVKCTPITGRMHQIRVHLQWLGFPIVGDPIYSHPNAFGTSRGKNGDCPPVDQIIDKLLEGRELQQVKFEQQNQCGRKRKIDDSTLCEDSEFYDPNCEECLNGFYGTNLKLIMCLHSRRYKVFDLEFVAKLPDWCFYKIPLDQLEKLD